MGVDRNVPTNFAGDLKMEKRLVLISKTALCVLAFGLIARAREPSNVAGTWIITNQGQNGVVVNKLTLAQDGAHLKGTIKPEEGEELQIDNGMVRGKNVSFSVTREEKNGKVKVEYKGTVSGDNGDNMTGTFRQGQSTVKWAAKRQVYDEGG
jgi:hypothetical protein